MTRRWLAMAALAIGGVAAGAIAVGNDNADAPIVAREPSAPVRVTTLPDGAVRGATPMAQRVATIGILNKRNGLSRDLRLKPGQGVRIGDAIVKVRACDQTEPWETEQLTGAFVQLIVQGSDQKWRRYFSGWLYKETPSLNVAQHPVYDVWVKACTMRHPDVGPNTVVVSGPDAGDSGGRSKAKKSPSVDESPTEDPSTDSAPSSNAT